MMGNETSPRNRNRYVILDRMDTDVAIFTFVFGLRIVVPLFILRFPLPAILASLVIDAADQTIFQNWTDIDLDKLNYQGYDKALDIFYLTVAYISTFRNWRHAFAIAVAAFLWYYRLVGVALFELTEWRSLLILFPNTFEYFFIFMALVRIRWDATRLSKKQVLLAAGAIWVFIKLPQEYWIHIAQLDTTDFLKEDVFGVAATDSWGTALTNRPAVSLLILAIVAAAGYGLVWLWRRLPPGDHRLTFDADKVPPFQQPRDLGVRAWRDGLFEKIVLLVLICLIFVQALPDTDVTISRVTVVVGAIVAANAFVSQLLGDGRFFGGRGRTWATAAGAFAGTLAVNSAIWLVIRFLLPTRDGGSNFAYSAFFLLLISLIVSLFDRYRPVAPRFDDPPADLPTPPVTAPS